MTTNQSNRILSIATIAFCSYNLNLAVAQSGITTYVSAGSTNIEVNGSGLVNLVDPYIKPIAAYTFGVNYEKTFSQHFAVMTGAHYSSRGFGAREEFNVGVFGLDLPIGASLETRLNYLEAPLMIKYNFTETGVTPYIKAGASAAYAVSGKITPKVNALINWTLPSININLDNEIYNRFDLAAVAGAGVSIPTGTFGAIQLEATYRHSLNNMLQDNITNIGIKSHGFSGGIGYTIRF